MTVPAPGAASAPGAVSAPLRHQRFQSKCASAGVGGGGGRKNRHRLRHRSRSHLTLNRQAVAQRMEREREDGRKKEGNGKLGGWIARQARQPSGRAGSLGKWVIRRASAACSVIACKTLHTLRNCQLPKGSEISNFGNKDENSKQSWATGDREGNRGHVRRTDGRATYLVQNRTRRTERERERERDNVVEADVVVVARGG